MAHQYWRSIIASRANQPIITSAPSIPVSTPASIRTTTRGGGGSQTGGGAGAGSTRGGGDASCGIASASGGKSESIRRPAAMGGASSEPGAADKLTFKSDIGSRTSCTSAAKGVIGSAGEEPTPTSSRSLSSTLLLS